MQDCSIGAPCSPHAVDGEASSESMSEAFSESIVTPKAFSAVLLLMRVLLPRRGFSRQLADFAVPAHFPRTPPHPASNMVLPFRQHTRIFFCSRQDYQHCAVWQLLGSAARRRAAMRGRRGTGELAGMGLASWLAVTPTGRSDGRPQGQGRGSRLRACCNGQGARACYRRRRES